MIDLHSHILVGVADGAATIEEARELASMMWPFAGPSIDS